MNTRDKIIFTVLAVFLFLNVSAQQFYNSVNPLTTASNTLNQKLTGRQYYFVSTINGTVYLKDDWGKCNITLENGDYYENINVKLNTLLDDIIVFNERTGSIFILDKSIVKSFEMEVLPGLIHTFRKEYIDRAPKGEHYVDVLYDGKVKLYLWNQTLEVKVSAYKDAHGLLRDSEFKPVRNYLIIFPDNSVHKVALKRRSFVRLFPEQKKTMRRLLRKNRIHFMEPGDLSKATQLVESEFFQ